MKALVLLLLATPAFAQNPCPPDDDEPCPILSESSQAPRETVEIVRPPAPPRPSPGRTVVEIAAMPGYMRLLGSDFLGTQLSLGIGGRARKTGFVAMLRFGGYFGASTFDVPFQHFTIAAVFEIPTGTRFRLTLGHQFGVLALEEAHTAGGAYSLTMGGFIEPTVDLWRHDSQTFYLAGRVAYDFVDGRSDNSVATLNLGVGYSF